MKVKGKYSESAVLYAVLLIVGLIAAVAVFFVVLNITGSSVPEVKLPEQTKASSTEAAAPPETAETAYDPGSDLSDEMKDAVIRLIKDNHTVLTLYYTEGLPHKDEPYGNEPEDGYFSVDDDRYTSLAQIEEIVDRTYTKNFASEVKTNPLGYGAIYKTRDNGDLGIIANFTPMTYDGNWENPDFKIVPLSDTECTIELTIHLRSDGSEKLVTAQMIKEDGEWKLMTVVF